jgi:3-methyladenine DNA glycosylase AlkC
MYTPQLIGAFADKVVRVSPSFDRTGFVETVLDKSWEDRELKDRYHRIAEVLGKFLPSEYPEAVGVLEKLAEECRGFPYLFFPEFISMFGLEHWEVSIRALRLFTPSSSSEFAVRPFIEQDQERMLAVMLGWTRDPNEHVRRLASEGCRPRLPWGKPLKGLIKEPAPILPILEALKADDSEYVRRSVANNLNDISKDHPELVLELTARWKGISVETDRLLKHACRTLLKKGHPAALSLFGFGANVESDAVEVTGLETQPSPVRLGEELRFSFMLSSVFPASFRLQFAIDYVKANGSTSQKRFHLPEHKQFSGSETITRSISFQDFTTRKHYAGMHRLSILVNGAEKSSVSFLVEGRE